MVNFWVILLKKLCNSYFYIVSFTGFYIANNIAFNNAAINNHTKSFAPLVLDIKSCAAK